ncbi:MAG: SpoIID/LytB domain-containing protein [Actinobacteria bacterium]|nr:SpoIID/LytB domain-containing protein [Actinomycetota bacterium]
MEVFPVLIRRLRRAAAASRSVLIAALVGLLALPAPRAGADSTFTFHGMGWGHRIGMSQWGAYGLALEGWSAGAIVRHFYTGTTVGVPPSKPGRVRVGLIQGQTALHVKAEDGKVELRLGSPGGELIRAIPKGATWTIEVQSGKYRIVSAKGNQIGGLWGGPWRHLFLRYVPLGSRVRITEAGHAYGRGWVELNVYPSGAPNLLRAIANVPARQYPYGVAEVSSSWPGAALRAQVLALRSYVFEKIARLGQHRTGCNCAVYATTADQVYAGWDKESGFAGDRWVDAVDDTAGKAILHQGQPIQAYYHASSGGVTEANEDQWGGSPLPYLRSVCDPGDWTGVNPYATWSVTLSGTAVGAMLEAATGKDVGQVTGFSGVVRGAGGGLRSITANGTDGSVTVGGTTFRSALGLRSTRVWVNSNRTIKGEIREKYDALSCAPGLPKSAEVDQTGGHRQRFAVGALYHNHTRGLVRWLFGAIHTKYVALGEGDGVLGMPRSGIIEMAKLNGERTRFEAGFVYWKAATGAHEIHGRVVDHFLANGKIAAFGFPTTDVIVKANGVQRADFDKGWRIRCPPAKACTQIAL